MKPEERYRRRPPRSRLIRTTRKTIVESLRSISRWRDRNQLWDIVAMTTWIEQAAGAQDLLVSVILPTRNRPELLPRAIESVIHQVHEQWELIVVDDCSTGQIQDIVASFSEPRMRVVAGPGRGPAAARNTGITASTGEVITYVDDDNCLDRLWIRGVAWAFTRYPEAELLYGARVMNPRSLGRGQLWPELQFPRYRRWWLRRSNFVDVGMIAHRRRPAGADFDENIPAPHEDWDFMLRMTREQPPLRLPMISSYYFTDAPHRQSDLSGEAKHDETGPSVFGGRRPR
jgi:hypothetical protein